MSPNRREIYDALTCESSIEGCDPDWRRKVLGNATSDDLRFVRGEIEKSQSCLDSEIKVALIRQGKI